MRNSKLIGLLFAGASALFGGEADGSIYKVFQQTNNTGYSLTKDTHINSNQANLHQFNARNFSAKGSNPRLEGLIRFEGIFGDGEEQIPYGSKIESSMLTFNLTEAGQTGTNVHRMVQYWPESVTWNQMGGDGINPNGIEASVKITDSFNSNVLGGIELNVTDDLTLWSQGVPNYGWALIPNNLSDISYDIASSEYDDISLRPKLEINYFLPVPEPATLSLIGIGVGALGFRRKR